MSSIDFVNKRITWTGTNNIGLNDDWVKELVAEGHTLDDRREHMSGKRTEGEG